MNALHAGLSPLDFFAAINASPEGAATPSSLPYRVRISRPSRTPPNFIITFAGCRTSVRKSPGFRSTAPP